MMSLDIKVKLQPETHEMSLYWNSDSTLQKKPYWLLVQILL